jgi:hypothetical protein
MVVSFMLAPYAFIAGVMGGATLLQTIAAGLIAPLLTVLLLIAMIVRARGHLL